MNDIIRFEIAKINRGKARICICEEPHYEIDTVNRLVTCEDCGAVIDAFDVLTRFVEDMERIERQEKRMLQQAETNRKFAEEEFRRRIRNKAFKDMDESYRKGMLPHCPKCHEIFDPALLVHWTNKAFISKEEVENETN